MEFVLVDASTVVVVDDLEHPLEADDAAGASLPHPVSEFLKDFLLVADVARAARVLLNEDLLS